jgi:hypothetical protein
MRISLWWTHKRHGHIPYAPCRIRFVLRFLRIGMTTVALFTGTPAAFCFSVDLLVAELVVSVVPFDAFETAPCLTGTGAVSDKLATVGELLPTFEGVLFWCSCATLLRPLDRLIIFIGETVPCKVGLPKAVTGRRNNRSTSLAGVLLFTIGTSCVCAFRLTGRARTPAAVDGDPLIVEAEGPAFDEDAECGGRHSFAVQRAVTGVSSPLVVSEVAAR